MWVSFSTDVYIVANSSGEQFALKLHRYYSIKMLKLCCISCFLCEILGVRHHSLGGGNESRGIFLCESLTVYICVTGAITLCVSCLLGWAGRRSGD